MTEKREDQYYPDPRTLDERFAVMPERDDILGYLARYNISLEEFFRWPRRGSLHLSDIGILRHLVAGNVIIDPFRIDQLSPSTYEVGLGNHFYRHYLDLERLIDSFFATPKRTDVIYHSLLGHNQPTPMRNPRDQANTRYIWQPVLAIPISQLEDQYKIKLEGIGPQELGIILMPNEQVLGHTQEYIGGKNVIKCLMSARSSTGRSMIRVCNDANIGHPGFTSRWTMEIRNESAEEAITLVVGDRYAQISFMETEPVAQSYQGNYQAESNIEEVKANWKPEMMLPRGAKAFSVIPQS